jgi:Ner family transcriptional regulator
MNPEAEKNASPTDWHPEDVIAALHKAGYTLSSLARQHGLSCSSSFSATLRERCLPKNEARIAAALGVAPSVIWPSRYDAEGNRKARGFAAFQFSAARAGRNGKAADAVASNPAHEVTP